jgi:hypothetical protein
MLRRLESEGSDLMNKPEQSYDERGRLGKIAIEIREITGLKNETEKRLRALGRTNA